jgi:hypothetical protein
LTEDDGLKLSPMPKEQVIQFSPGFFKKKASILDKENTNLAHEKNEFSARADPNLRRRHVEPTKLYGRTETQDFLRKSSSFIEHGNDELSFRSYSQGSEALNLAQTEHRRLPPFNKPNIDSQKISRIKKVELSERSYGGEILLGEDSYSCDNSLRLFSEGRTRASNDEFGTKKPKKSARFVDSRNEQTQKEEKLLSILQKLEALNQEIEIDFPKIMSEDSLTTPIESNDGNNPDLFTKGTPKNKISKSESLGQFNSETLGQLRNCLTNELKKSSKFADNEKSSDVESNLAAQINGHKEGIVNQLAMLTEQLEKSGRLEEDYTTTNNTEFKNGPNNYINKFQTKRDQNR